MICVAESSPLLWFNLHYYDAMLHTLLYYQYTSHNYAFEALHFNIFKNTFIIRFVCLTIDVLKFMSHFNITMLKSLSFMINSE